MLITLEGGDGAGKTTALPVIAEMIKSITGRDVVQTKEPGGTPLGAKLRELLLSDKEGMTRTAELLLMMADRAQHVQQVIEPALERGGIVLCDRYIDSTFAYQGYGRGHEIELIHQLNEISTGGLKPFLTLLFDVSIETGLARATVKTKFEGLGREFQERVLLGFREAARQNPDRFRVVDANQSFDDVIDEVRGHLVSALIPGLTETGRTSSYAEDLAKMEDETFLKLLDAAVEQGSPLRSDP